MGQRGWNHFWNHWAQPQLRDGKFLHLPASRRKVRFFCGSGDDRSCLALPAPSRHQLALAAPGMVQQQLWVGWETLWESFPWQRTTGADRSWMGCAANAAGELGSSCSAGRLHGEGALNTMWRCEVTWTPQKLSPRARWQLEHSPPCRGVALTSRYCPCSVQGGWIDDF